MGKSLQKFYFNGKGYVGGNIVNFGICKYILRGIVTSGLDNSKY